MTTSAEDDFKLQRQIDRLEGKVDSHSEQLNAIKELINDKLDRIRSEADTDRRQFQQAITILNSQIERNTTSMSGTETRVALVEVEHHNLDSLAKAEHVKLNARIDALSNRLWWIAGIFGGAGVAFGFGLIQKAITG